MLIQLPGGSPDQQGSRGADSANAFEAGLRRDLASAPVVSYDTVLGGWGKRVADLTLALLSAPLWLPLMLAVAAWSKLRHPAPVFQAHERVGYGGRPFKCRTLRVVRPSAQIERLRVVREGEAEPANDLSAMAGQAEGRRAKWMHVLERLPQMINVIAGDMAIVGPSPLTRDELEPLKTARRYYLSARPGVIGVSALVEGGPSDPTQFKAYALSWAFETDALIVWEALRSLRDRGELWKPSAKLVKVGQNAAKAEVVVRRRSAS
jgi:exopolysaccharide production protein ExoY